MAKLRRIHVPGENRLLAALPRDEHVGCSPIWRRCPYP